MLHHAYVIVAFALVAGCSSSTTTSPTADTGTPQDAGSDTPANPFDGSGVDTGPCKGSGETCMEPLECCTHVCSFVGSDEAGTCH